MHIVNMSLVVDSPTRPIGLLAAAAGAAHHYTHTHTENYERRRFQFSCSNDQNFGGSALLVRTEVSRSIVILVDLAVICRTASRYFS